MFGVFPRVQIHMNTRPEGFQLEICGVTEWSVLLDSSVVGFNVVADWCMYSVVIFAVSLCPSHFTRLSLC